VATDDALDGGGTILGDTASGTNGSSRMHALPDREVQSKVSGREASDTLMRDTTLREA